MLEAPLSFGHRWWLFIRERFPLGPQLLLIGAFFLGNAGFALILPGEEPWRQLAAAGLVVLLIFLRLRVFDEIKDFPSDRQLHPDRPLSRGMISLG